jgi:t-SNARE complex subunit (syntaxin)
MARDRLAELRGDKYIEEDKNEDIKLSVVIDPMILKLAEMKKDIKSQRDMRIKFKTCSNRESQDLIATTYKTKTVEIKNKLISLKKIKMNEMQKHRLLDLISEFSKEIDLFKIEEQTIFKRRVKILDRTMTDDEIEKLMDNGVTVKQIYEQSLQDNSVNLRNIVANIEERHLDIIKLESEVLAVYELFRDLELLVDLQQDSMDVISKHIEKAKKDVAIGEDNLNKAAEYQDKARKKQCCCLMIVLIILVVVILLFWKVGNYF